MKIGIVIDKLYPGKIGGAEQYVRNIISVMGNKEGIELTLFLNETALGLFENENPERIRCVCVPYQIPRASCLYEYYIAKYGLQVLFCPLFYIPYESCSIPIVTSILDIQYEYYPEYFTSDLLQYRRDETKKALINSAAIITISEFSKKTMLDKLGADGEKIYVTYLNSDSSFDDKVNAEKNKEMKKKLPEHYFFYPANGWAHKNHKRLIDAYKILKEKHDTKCKLVLTGNAFNDKNGLMSCIRENKLESDVITLGYIDQKDMPYVFVNAEMLVFPSLFEGFGIPLVEAMRMGTPIACSDCGSIPEIAGDAAIMFNALDAADMAEKIHRLEADIELQEELREKGYQRARIFSWKKSAEQTLEILERYGLKESGLDRKRLLPKATLLLPVSADRDDIKKLVQSIESQNYPNKEVVIFSKNIQILTEVKKSINGELDNIQVVELKELKRFLSQKISDNADDITGILQTGQFFKDEQTLERIVLEVIMSQEDIIWIMPRKEGFYGSFLANNINNKKYQRYICYDKACGSALFVRNNSCSLLEQAVCGKNGFYQEEIIGSLMRENIPSRFVLMECILDYGRQSGRKGRKYRKMLQELWDKEKYLSWTLINTKDIYQRILVNKLVRKGYNSADIRSYYMQVRNHGIEFDGILPDGWMSKCCEMEIEISGKESSLEIIGNNLNIKTGIELAIYIDEQILTRKNLLLGEFQIKTDILSGLENGRHVLRLEAEQTFSYYEQTKRDIFAFSVQLYRIFVNEMVIWEI